MNHPAAIPGRRRLPRSPGATGDYLLRRGVLKLLAIKDSDIRLLTLEQCRDAVDKSLHAGGAFSATIPLVALYYGGFMDIDVVDPTRRGQDLFTLSKGHAVAALASIYAELGYFDRSVLRNSRSVASILNGHPGPILPGIHIATGPMGQGFAVAQGFALAGRSGARFDSYCLTGDGELQEGPIWEAVMYAGQKRLDNLCVMVDRNNGQLDIANRLVFPMPHLGVGVRVLRLAGAQRRRDAVRRRVRRARAVQVRRAQREADRDHLPWDEGTWRAVGFHEQAQGHGAGCPAAAGADAPGGLASGACRGLPAVSRAAGRSGGRPRAAGRAARDRQGDAARSGRLAIGPAGIALRDRTRCRPRACRRETSASRTTPRCCRSWTARRNTPPAMS